MGTEGACELTLGSRLESERRAPCERSLRALTKHPRVMPYRRLMAGVVVVNVAILVARVRAGAWQLADGSALAALSTLTLVNVTVAVLVRNQAFLNALYGLAGRGSPIWPLWIRWSISKVHHVGGLHVGCAVAGTAWLGAFTGAAIVTAVRFPGSVTALTLACASSWSASCWCVTVCATSPIRMRAHNVFEQTHRWCGWSAIAVFWALTVHLATRRAGHDERDRRRRDRLARLGARRPDGERRVAVAAAAASAGHGRPAVVARRHRPPRLRRTAAVRVGRRHQPQPVA